MAHETRIGLLVGMGFIICFAIILSNRGGLDRVAPQMPYQLFGGPAAPAPRTAGSAAQERARRLDLGQAGDSEVQGPVIPQPLSPDARQGGISPRRSRPARPQGEADPERFIQRRRSLLPSRELAGRGGAVPADDESPIGEAVAEYTLASDESGTFPADEAIIDGEGDETEVVRADEAEGDEVEVSAAVMVDGGRPELPAVLAGYAEQLEVVTPDAQRRREDSGPDSDASAQPTERPSPAGDEAPSDLAGSHKVEKGDSLIRIARRYYGDAGKDILGAILAANRGIIRSPEFLVVGKTLRLPVIGERVPNAVVVRNATAAPPGMQPAPRREPPTSRPARKSKLGTKPVSESVADPRIVLAATTPEVRAAPVAVAAEPTWRWYTVRKGDLYSTIAQEQLGTSKRWKELLDLNKDVCADARQLRCGSQIRIPGGVLADAR